MTAHRASRISADAVPQHPHAGLVPEAGGSGDGAPASAGVVGESSARGAATASPMGGDAVPQVALAGLLASGDRAPAPERVVECGARRVAEALVVARSGGDRKSWVEVVAACQALVNTVGAVQDAAIVQVARREQVWCEDGTLGEVVHAPGRVSVDAADLVAPAIGASHAQAQRRVEQAVRVAGNRVPTQVEDRDLPEHSGLAGLHTAMTTGHLDGYRACVVAHELEHAPAEVADAVVTALGAHLGSDDPPDLRRRTRRLIARICPDLLRQRAQQARATTGLRRWVAEPGVDEWHGTFPSEDAATAWAAIDTLAHDLVTAGTCTHIEQARGKALTDLVTGNATIDVQIVLTTPADVAPDPCDPEPTPSGDFVGPATVHATAPANGPSAGADPATTDATAPADTLNRGTGTAPGIPNARTVSTAKDEDLVQVQGARPSEPLLVRRGWLRDLLRKRPTRPRREDSYRAAPFAPCDPRTGARLDPAARLATQAYRPGDRLAALVRARDGRCRFPGCTVAARFCDLDHVRPWPAGPTSATNLICLCRRHHRIKQRPGWSVRLDPDGTTHWADPVGQQRTTEPLDALATLVLAYRPLDDAPPEPAAAERHGATTGPWSALQTHLEIALEHHTMALPLLGHLGNSPVLDHPTHRRCTTATQLREAFARRRRASLPDDPPF